MGFIEVDVRGFRGVEGVPARYQTVRVKALVKTDAPQEKVDELAHLVRAPPHLEVHFRSHTPCSLTRSSLLQVHKKCPVAVLFHDAGVQMDVSWTKV